MTVTAESFLEDYPQFQAFNPDRLDRIVARHNRRLSSAQWGDDFDDAVSLLVAHDTQVATDAENAEGRLPGQVGGVQSESVQGDYSTTYVDSSSSNSSSDPKGDDYLRLTAYGQQFLQLRSQVILPLGIY